MTKIMAKCTDNDRYEGQLTIGKIYEVEPVFGDNLYKFIDDRGEMVRAWQSRFEVVSETQVDTTPVSPEIVPSTTPQFKAGDRVRIIGNSNIHNRKIGDICYLVEPHFLGRSWGTSSTQGGRAEDGCYIRPSDMELSSTVSTPTVALTNTPTEFKVGDKVKIRKDSAYYGASDTHNPADAVGEVVRIDSIGSHNYKVQWPDGRNDYRAKDLELAEQPAIMPEPEPEIPSKWANVEIGYY